MTIAIAQRSFGQPTGGQPTTNRGRVLLPRTLIILTTIMAVITITGSGAGITISRGRRRR